MGLETDAGGPTAQLFSVPVEPGEVGTCWHPCPRGLRHHRLARCVKDGKIGLRKVLHRIADNLRVRP
jgi:hypothetical protein